jgi:hypothetical protein
MLEIANIERAKATESIDQRKHCCGGYGGWNSFQLSGAAESLFCCINYLQR